MEKWEKGHSSGECDNGECSNWINIVVKGTELGGQLKGMRRGGTDRVTEKTKKKNEAG